MIKLPTGESGPFARALRENRLEKWGEEEFEIAQQEIRNYRTCIDIGAHVGLTTLRYAQHFEDVLSFEPVHIDLLKENTSQFSNITYFDVALSDQNRYGKMIVREHNSGRNNLSDLSKEESIEIEYKEVEVRTLDSFKFTHVDFIKIDVEGYTLEVLKGARETIDKWKPIIQAETLKRSKKNYEVKDLLSNWGYTRYKEYGDPVDEFWRPKQ